MENLTYIIPVFNLCEYRICNLQKILNDIISHNCDIIIAEQYTESSTLQSVLSGYNSNKIRHIKLKSSSKNILKSKLINISTRFVNTSHFFLHDVDLSLNYKQLYGYYNNKIEHDYIQPFEIARDLSKQETILYKSGKLKHIEYFPPNTKINKIRHVNVYGALGFIIKKSIFEKNKGFDESYTGWGYEDFDFFMRIHHPLPLNPLISIPRGVNGVHMWHPPSDSSEYHSNLAIFKHKGFTRGKINTLLKRYYYPDWDYDVLEPV